MPSYLFCCYQVEAWKMAKAGLLYTGQDEEVRSTIQTFLSVLAFFKIR
jgi:hypothetical protein